MNICYDNDTVQTTSFTFFSFLCRTNMAARPALVSRGRSKSRQKVVTPKVGQCHSDHLPRKVYQSSRVIGGPAGITTPRRPFFDIHPEWKSESVTLQRLHISDRKVTRPPVTSGYHTYPPRRCKSAPPCTTRSRNPITWTGF